MRYAWDALRRRRGRSVLTALGIGLATALVVVLLAFGAGIRSSSIRLADASGVDLLATSRNTTFSSETFPPIAGAHALARAMAQADPNVASVSPWLVSNLVYGNASLYAAANASTVPGAWTLTTNTGSIGWIPSDNAGLEVPTVLNGSGFTIPGDPHYANGTYDGPSTHEVVLDQGLASVLHVDVGDLVWASPRSAPGPSAVTSWYAEASVFRVVGVSGPFWLLPSALLGFFYLSELQTLVGGASAGTDYASLVLVHLYDPTRAPTDQSLLQAAFPALSVFTLQEILQAVQNFVDLYQTFGEIIGLIGIGVATLFTTSVLVMSVDDRSRELALLRALGFTRARVGGLVLEEAALLALFGLAVGLPAAFLTAYGLNLALTHLVGSLPVGFSFLAYPPSVFASGLLEVLAIGLVASVLPAVRAMQLPVVEELRAP